MAASPHRKLVRHFHTPGDLHELTFSTYRRWPLLTNPADLPTLSRAIDAGGSRMSVQVVAFVYMPEHIHLLTYPLLPEPDFGLYLARIKQPFSKAVKARLLREDSPWWKRLTIQERPGKTCFRLWQEGPGFDRNLNQAPAIRAAIDYIHRNPVRRGLCERAVDWKWSSARYYLNDPPRQQEPHLPFIHGVPVGALD